MDYIDLIASGVSVAATLVSHLLALVLGALRYAYAVNPTVTKYCILLVVFYVAYRLFLRAVKLWINLLITTIKTLVTLTILAVVFVVYLRGFRRLVNQDIPYARQLIGLLWYGADDTPDLVQSLLGIDVRRFFVNVKQATYNSGSTGPTSGSFLMFDDVDDAAAYFDYMKHNFKESKKKVDFESIQDWLHDGWNSVEDYLQDSGVDVNYILHNIINH